MSWTEGRLASGRNNTYKVGDEQNQKLLIVLNSLAVFLPIYCMATKYSFVFVPALLFEFYMDTWQFGFFRKLQRFTAGLMLDGEWIPIVVSLSCSSSDKTSVISESSLYRGGKQVQP
jgi:hypothetical protein